MTVLLFVGPFCKEFETMKLAQDAFWVFTVMTGGKFGPGWFVKVASSAAGRE